MHFLVELDILVFRKVNNWMRYSHLNKVMSYLTFLGGAVASTIICFILLLVGHRINGLGRSAVLAVVGSQLVVYIVKRSVSRLRPYQVLESAKYREELLLKDYSFPSGHTAASFALAVVLSLYFPGAAPVFLALAALVGISRVYLGLHYPLDVLFGALLGAGFAVVICLYGAHLSL